MDQNIDNPVAANAEETVESCQRRILELVASTQQKETAPEHIPDVEGVAKQIARLYARMGDLFLSGKDLDKAAKCYETALQLDPSPWSPHEGLLRSRAFMMAMLDQQPDNASLLNQLGEMNYKLGERDLALDCFRKAITLEPENADSHYWIAGIQQAMGNIKAAEESYIRAAQLKPLFKVPASKTLPDFSVLVISAPLLANTPTEYLMENPSYEINTFPLFSDTKYDIALLKRSGQIVFNTVSEADQSRSALQQVAGFIDRLDMPVINHPAKIQKTTREGIARLLQDIPQCRLGRVVRHSAGSSVAEKDLQASIPFSFPILARPTGTHGGEKFEKIESLPALKGFIEQNPPADHYLIEYIDYKSKDGHFRKYRFIFVNDRIMPYHLAIGNDWKVHHNTTDMHKVEWMQAEEKAFLEKPESVFSPQHYKTLQAIQRAVGLEYFGIDCGIDQEGNLVVFEVNASMLVHHHNEKFPYKTPFVENIKQAFDEMLKKTAESR